jgi:hypothetical protein
VRDAFGLVTDNGLFCLVSYFDSQNCFISNNFYPAVDPANLTNLSLLLCPVFLSFLYNCYSVLSFLSIVFFDYNRL